MGGLPAPGALTGVVPAPSGPDGPGVRRMPHARGREAEVPARACGPGIPGCSSLRPPMHDHAVLRTEVPLARANRGCRKAIPQRDTPSLCGQRARPMPLIARSTCAGIECARRPQYCSRRIRFSGITQASSPAVPRLHPLGSRSAPPSSPRWPQSARRARDRRCALGAGTSGPVEAPRS